MGNKKGDSRVVFAHITIGIQLAITMVIFVIGGNKLDVHYDTSPLFLIIGTVFGMGIGFYHLLKDLQEPEKKKEDDEDIKKRESVKWNR